LRNAELRVWIGEWYAQAYKKPLSNKIEGWGGYVCDFWYDLSKEAGFDLIVVPDVSSAARDLSPGKDDWELCLDDIALGYVDLCLPTIWVQPDRKRKVDFLPTLKKATIKMVVFKQRVSKTNTDLWFRFMAPFSNALWFSIALTVAVLALVYAILEAGNVDDFPNTFSDDPEHNGLCSTLLRQYSQGLYNMFFSVASGSPVMTPRLREGKLVNLGFGFGILVVIAAYTAETAAILLDVKVKGQINGVEDLADRRLKVCIPSVTLKHKILSEYPDLAGLIITPDDKIWTGDEWSFDAMDARKCSAAIMPEEIMNIQFMEKETHCVDKMMLPELIVTSLDESVPFHTEHLRARANERALSFHTLTAVYNGKFDALKATESERIGLDGCILSDQGGLEQLTTDHFFGLFLVVVTTSIILPLGIRLHRVYSEGKSSKKLSEEEKQERLHDKEKKVSFTRSQMRYAHLIAETMATQFAVNLENGQFVKVARDGTHEISAEERRLLESTVAFKLQKAPTRMVEDWIGEGFGTMETGLQRVPTRIFGAAAARGEHSDSDSGDHGDLETMETMETWKPGTSGKPGNHDSKSGPDHGNHGAESLVRL
jgi:hypothetical protein